MNDFRKKLVHQAFKKFDKDGNGQIDIHDLKGVYSGKKHPDVLQGKKTEEQVLNEWLETFESHHAMMHDHGMDHIVTLDEFEEYYHNISSSIDDDQYFKVMITNAWNLDNSRVTRPGWSNKADVTTKVGTKTSRPMMTLSAKAQPARPQTSAGCYTPRTTQTNFQQKMVLDHP